MANQSISVGKNAKNEFFVKVKLVVGITREESGIYFAQCPVLDVCSQGSTIKEAKENIAEAISLFIDYCCDKGILEEMLEKRGFLRLVVGKVPQKAASRRHIVPRRVSNTRSDARFEHIPVSIPFHAVACQ